MNKKRFLTAGLSAVLFLSSCFSQATLAAEILPDAEPITQSNPIDVIILIPEAEPDIPSDSNSISDATKEFGLDSVSDTAPDAGLDSASDTAPDAGLDSAPDTAPDSRLDSASDTAPDSGLDSAPDTAPNSASESESDTAPGSTPSPTLDSILGDGTTDVGSELSNDANQLGSAQFTTTEKDPITTKSNLSGDLSVILKGLTEQNKSSVISSINSLIGSVLTTGTPKDITQSNLIDAEKYNVNSTGYDSQLCWAATAANTLWLSGYAQEAVNPQTGKKFASEDEVFHYFQMVFTDQAGVPDGGTDYFMNGSYPYADEPAASQVKNTAPTGGFLSSVSYAEDLIYLCGGNSSKIVSLDHLTGSSFGALLKWIDKSTGVLVSGAAHWLTVVGVVMDENESNIQDKYKAIILADSDSDPSNSSLGLSDDVKLSTKKNSPNTYSVYKLSLVDFSGSIGKAWTVENYSGSSYYTILTYLYELKDLEKDPAKKKELENLIEDLEQGFADQSTDADSSAANESILLQTYDTIKQIMIGKDTLTYSATDYSYKANSAQNFVTYVRTSSTFVYRITLDGKDIPAGCFSMKDCGNGIFRLTLTADYMKSLSTGKHTIKLGIQGLTDPIVIPITIG